MSLVRRRVPLTLAAIAVITACESQSLLPPPATWTAQIAGTVRSPTGEPVGKADVVLSALFIDAVGKAKMGGCSGSTALPLEGKTDSLGRFSLTWHGAVDPAFICMRVQGTGVMNGKSVSGTAEMDSVTLGPTGVDSLHVSVVVEPPAQP